MSSRLADYLDASRRAQFVGRSPERALFTDALDAQDPPFFLLYIHGPGGIGKSSLLREYGRICAARELPAVYLDCRNVEPIPDSFNAALNAAAGLPSNGSLTDMAGDAKKFILLLDTYETLTPLDDWLREAFLPQLPGNVIVVVASRTPPRTAWRADPGWQALMHTVALRNLDPEESRTYLSRRKIPTDQQNSFLNFSHGHPLALSLIADTFAQRGAYDFNPDSSRDLVTSLVETFLQKVPGPAHRAAIESCALIRVTTESVLGKMLGSPDVHDLFKWLEELSFVESRPGGLFPHDLARDALVADLRWRNPDWYAQLHTRARSYYTERIGMTSGVEQQRALFDLIYLHRDNPVIQPFFAWQAGGNLRPDSLRPEDVSILKKMVSHFEGAVSAELASYWLDAQPQGVLVLRKVDGGPAGFLTMVDLGTTTPAERAKDPAIAAAWRTLEQSAPLRPGERATHFRFWMDAEAYQSVSPVQSLIFIHIVRHYLTTAGLAYTFFPAADQEFWAPMSAYANLSLNPGSAFSLDAKSFAVFSHDWRAEPPAAWLGILAEREMSVSGETPTLPQAQASALVVLSQPDFADAVWDALRAFKRPDQLAENPLVRSQLISRALSKNAEKDSIGVLQQLIGDAVEEVKETRRGINFYRVLYHTYIQPAQTQEQAAELLDLPYSTFRRYLKTGIERVTDILWAKELGK